MKQHVFTLQGIELKVITEDNITRAEAFHIALSNLSTIRLEVYQTEFPERAPVIAEFISNLK